MSVELCDRGRLLVVEDNAATRALYAVIIAEYLPGLNVEQTVNGQEGVQAFEAHHHGVIVMDLHMPVMGGLEAFRRIEELCREKRWAMPSVVFCTAYAPPQAFAEILGEGTPHCLLEKPMRGDQLVDALKRGINKLSQSGA